MAENARTQCHLWRAETVRNAFYRLYYAFQRALVPGLRNSQESYREVLDSRVGPGTLWLDLGCGHRVFPDWMPRADEDQNSLTTRCARIVGIDYDLPSLRKHKGIANKVRGDIQRLPFKDCSFDLVTANVVVEHVQDPRALLAEVHRVLRPGGIFLIHTPNLYAYSTVFARLLPTSLKIKLIYLLQGRRGEDVFPTYYRMNSAHALNTLSQDAGFEVSALTFVESSAQTVMLPPIVIFELLLIRILRTSALRRFRTNLIAVLQNKQIPSGAGKTNSQSGEPELRPLRHNLLL